MVTHHSAEGYDDFCGLIKRLEDSGQPIYVLFSGSKDSDGKSWCPDCVAAEPVIDKVLKRSTLAIHFIHVGVGERAKWKDPNSPFRKDSRLLLTGVPTLLRWGARQRLVESECADEQLIEMILE
ncbi:thioredoxin domain-containing protein 17-like [Schistocerca serialis cubense]|uniref:thioredoxin domain-containing protein 17-like n=1 Tax=Schistocerca serialis cubense TaxID=2023355 RepID=UPI00214E7251|nr:thioredoxin domain-containing protein 17-like [Schistocerca serialis cubense]